MLAAAFALLANPAASAAPDADLAAFEANLAAHTSATEALTQWCAARGIAANQPIRATLVRGDDARPPAGLHRLLAIDRHAAIGYRHVLLVCGGTMLSEAHNWYVPARLTPEMNRQLAETDTPFGRVAATLAYRRHRVQPPRAAHPPRWRSAGAGARMLHRSQPRRQFRPMNRHPPDKPPPLRRPAPHPTFTGMSEGQYLAGRLLLALPGMPDPRFARSVIAMFVHDDNGALGVGIGQLAPGIGLHRLLEDLEIAPGVAPDAPVHLGGPVEPQRGFVLHSPDWDGPGTITASPLGALSTSIDVLRAIADGSGPAQWLVALGYAGWGPKQLDGEMIRHGWHAAEGRAAILFETPAEGRWAATWRAEGVDPALLAEQSGHA